MRRNISIQKFSQAQIDSLVSDASLAKRGLSDLTVTKTVETLQEEMFALFKNRKYSECFKVCLKIKEINSGLPIVNLLYVTSRRRMMEALRKSRKRRMKK